MNGYSKIKLVGSTKSRSMDFSDLLSPPQTPKPIEITSPSQTSKTHETKLIKNTNSTHCDSEPEDEDGNGESFGVILSRDCSVSSTASHRFIRFDKQGATTTLQSAVKRAFSMRRSSSVSERYCRIHYQCVTLASPIDDDDDAEAEGIMDNSTEQTRSMNKKKLQQYRTGKFLKE